MNYFYILLFLSTITYATEIDIRGYQFGESYATILNTEAQKKEYRLLPSKTNNNRLSYSGHLFNKPVNVIFNFRNQRLSSLSYIWQDITNDTLFLKRTQELLQNKYTPYQTKNIESKGSELHSTSYIQQTTNDNTILYINLENITLSNSTQTIILEFRAFDIDETIKQKILLEDI